MNDCYSIDLVDGLFLLCILQLKQQAREAEMEAAPENVKRQWIDPMPEIEGGQRTLPSAARAGKLLAGLRFSKATMRFMVVFLELIKVDDIYLVFT